MRHFHPLALLLALPMVGCPQTTDISNFGLRSDCSGDGDESAFALINGPGGINLRSGAGAVAFPRSSGGLGRDYMFILAEGVELIFASRRGPLVPGQHRDAVYTQGVDVWDSPVFFSSGVYGCELAESIEFTVHEVGGYGVDWVESFRASFSFQCVGQEGRTSGCVRYVNRSGI